MKAPLFSVREQEMMQETTPKDSCAENSQTATGRSLKRAKAHPPKKPSPAMGLRTTAVRAYASCEEAMKSGWTFMNPIGHLGKTVIHEIACASDSTTWLFDGVASHEKGLVPSDCRCFGNLQYKLSE